VRPAELEHFKPLAQGPPNYDNIVNKEILMTIIQPAIGSIIRIHKKSPF